MISGSVPWREDLISIGERLRRRGIQRRWTERTYFLVERDVMLGAYSIRRLNESYKLSTRLPSKRYPVLVHPLKDRVPRPLDRWNVDEFYDLDNGTKTEVDLVTLYNQIIHSFVFQLFDDVEKNTLVAVTSDRKRSSHLYVFELETLAGLFDYVGREDIVRMSRTTGDPEVRTSNHDLVEDGLANYGDVAGTWTLMRLARMPETGRRCDRSG